ncbi:MAG: hypothetical protein KGL39_42480 [Patescibacteria group bacterium]|nr:hypothetical protein [Patescibacteria group bacterium]
MSERANELHESIDNLIRCHKEWLENDGAPDPDPVYWDAVQAVVDCFAVGDMPSKCRELDVAVDKLAEQVRIFDERENVENQYPQDGFWEARQNLEDLRLRIVCEPPVRPLEPIAELAKLSGITHEQIARMWGLTDRRGQPMPWLVQRELDKPGSVIATSGSIDGRDWRDPREEERAKYEASRNKAIARAMLRKSRIARENDKPCHETPRELFEQKVSISQSAKMLKQSEAAVAQLFAQFDAEKLFGAGHSPEVVARTLSRPASDVEIWYRQWANTDENGAPIVEPDGPSTSTGEKSENVDQAIRELAIEGHDLADIAKEFGKSKRYVENVLKQVTA